MWGSNLKWVKYNKGWAENISFFKCLFFLSGYYRIRDKTSTVTIIAWNIAI